MCDPIGREVEQLRHFEELGILNEGIEPDRISDITTTILKPELITYTQRIASERGVPLVEHKVRAGAFDEDRHSFANATVALPTNPYTDGPIMLVPKRFLRELPTLNAQDWWDATGASELRNEFNAHIHKKLRKRDIVAIAKRKSAAVRAWVESRASKAVDPYDLETDPEGKYRPVVDAERYGRRNPLKLEDPTNHDEFLAVIEKVVAHFKHFVEKNRGWQLLWDGSKAKPETAAQLLFLGLTKSICAANNVVIDREVELGRGPVDFKFSSGYEHRALIEVEKLENGRFWEGIEYQFQSYLESDEQRDGWLWPSASRPTGCPRTGPRSCLAS